VDQGFDEGFEEPFEEGIGVRIEYRIREGIEERIGEPIREGIREPIDGGNVPPPGPPTKKTKKTCPFWLEKADYTYEDGRKEPRGLGFEDSGGRVRRGTERGMRRPGDRVDGFCGKAKGQEVRRETGSEEF